MWSAMRMTLFYVQKCSNWRVLVVHTALGEWRLAWCKASPVINPTTSSAVGVGMEVFVLDWAKRRHLFALNKDSANRFLGVSKAGTRNPFAIRRLVSVTYELSVEWATGNVAKGQKGKINIPQGASRAYMIELITQIVFQPRLGNDWIV